MSETCAWVLYDEGGNETEDCQRVANGVLTFTDAEGGVTEVPFCGFHAAIVDGVIL